MIPKKIHYCWFGKNKLPALELKCIASWRKYLPDYEIIEWNESNFDLNSNVYVREAYDAKKYAFVSDYVRLFALLNFGGIYMDTDVEVIKNLDSFLIYPAFTGFESEKDVPTGIIGSEKDGTWVKEQLVYYNNRNFKCKNDVYDLTTNTQIISRIMSNNGFDLKDGYQVYKDNMHVFPKNYFCPRTRSGELIITENTHCIHYFSGSWMPFRHKFKKYFFHQLLGYKLTDKLIKFKKKFRNK